MFKVILNDGKNEIPDEPGVSYVIGKDGIYLRKNIGITNSLTKVEQIGYLKEVDEFASMNLPKISHLKFEKVVKFFQHIHNTLHSEVMVLMLLKEDNSEVDFVIPIQVVTGATIDYKPVTVDGYYLVGSIHSHSSMSAFHSGTDVDDECDFDGLHITLGSFGSNNGTFSVSSEVAINGFRQEVNIEDYVDGIVKVKPSKIKKNKHKSKSKKTKPINNIGYINHPFYSHPYFENFIGNFNTSNKFEQSISASTRENIYKLESELLPADWVDEEWIKKVSKKQYVINKYTPKGIIHRTYGDYPYNFEGVGNSVVKRDIKVNADVDNKKNTPEETTSVIWEDNSFLNDFENLQDVIDMFSPTDDNLPCATCKHSGALMTLLNNMCEFLEIEETYNTHIHNESPIEIDYEGYDIYDDCNDIVVGDLKGDDPRLLSMIMRDDQEKNAQD